MATPFSGVFKLGEPFKMDVSVLGQAAQYKQGMYDQNTAAMQQLVNQYIGTDLLRDVDKQYLGERLGTLVNYVNQAGVMDWSNKNVFNNVANYVGQALDKNVMAAVASTAAYRKHVANMEDLKKNKPELYAIQNDWAATADMGRYLQENKIGDMYRQGTYVPYTDINKLVLDNAKLLKDFGAEMYFVPGESTPYFKSIYKTEKVTRQKVLNFLDSVLGTKGQQQLMIDAQYEYKGVDTKDIEKVYKEKMKYELDQVDAELSEQRNIFLKTPPSKRQANHEEFIKSLEDKKNDLVRQQTSTDFNRDKAIFNMHTADFKNKWAGTLSYTKVLDRIVDNTGFELAKFEHQVQVDSDNKKLAQAKFELDKASEARQAAKDRADAAMKEKQYQLELHKADLKVGKDGLLESTGFTVTNKPKTGKEEVQDTEALAQASANETYFKTHAQTVEKLQQFMSDPKNADKVKQVGLTKDNLKTEADKIINAPSKSAVLDMLDRETQAQLKVSIFETKAKQQEVINYRKSYEPVMQDLEEKAMAFLKIPYDTGMSTSTHMKNFQTMMGGDLLTKKGIKKGEVFNPEDTKKHGLSQEEIRDNALLAVYSNAIATQSIGEVGRQALMEKRNAILNKYSRLSGIDDRKMKKYFDPKRVFMDDKVKGVFVANMNIDDFADDDFIYQDKSTGKYHSALKPGSKNRVNQGVWGQGDINTDTPIVSEKSTSWEQKLSVARKSVLEKTRDFYGATAIQKQYTYDADTKLGKAAAVYVKAQLPADIILDTNSKYAISVDSKTMEATIEYGQKTREGTVARTVQVPFSELPPALQKSINVESTNPVFSSTSGLGVAYEKTSYNPKNMKEYSEMVALKHPSDYQFALEDQNRPKTQEELYQMIEADSSPDYMVKYNDIIKDALDKEINAKLIVDKNQQWAIQLTEKGSGNPLYVSESIGTTYDIAKIDQVIDKVVENYRISKALPGKGSL